MSEIILIRVVELGKYSGLLLIILNKLQITIIQSNIGIDGTE